MANRRYGRNQKRRHREAIKQLENKNKADQRRFMNINSDLEGKLAEYLALTECEVDYINKSYVSPSDGNIPVVFHQGQRKQVCLKKVCIRDMIELKAIDRGGPDYFSFRKKELVNTLLRGLQEYVSVEQRFGHDNVMIEACLVFESEKL